MAAVLELPGGSDMKAQMENKNKQEGGKSPMYSNPNPDDQSSVTSVTRVALATVPRFFVYHGTSLFAGAHKGSYLLFISPPAPTTSDPAND